MVCPIHVSRQSNPTYLLETDTGQRFVMRKQPPGKHPRGAHAVDREATVIGALGSKTGFPVPQVYALCTDASILGGMYRGGDVIFGPSHTDI